MKLYKFFVGCGRMGNVEGLFFAEESEIDDLIGKQIYFGEILGKHSEIVFNLEADHLTVINLSDDAVEELHKALGRERTISGYNPFDYYEEELG